MAESNPFRPLTPYEVDAKKADIMKEYRSGAATLPGTGQMLATSLEYTPDEAKYNLKTATMQLPNTGGEFDLHRSDQILSSEMRGPAHRPLGNLPAGHGSWNAMHVTKDVLDTSITSGQGGGILVRTDLVPTIYMWLNTRFPALDRIQKIPANGVSHTWNNEIDFGDATDDFIDEFGCPTVSHGVYFRGSTNIAIIAIERGTTLKLLYATAQSGMTYNGNQSTADIEMQNAILSKAKLLQKCFYYGVTASNTGGVSYDGTSEFGKTFLNGFNGLRVLLSSHANTVHTNFYPAGFGPVIGEVTSGGSITKAIDAVAGAIMDNGGMPTAIHLSTLAEQKLRDEGINLIRYSENDATVGGGLVLGGRVRAVDTVAGLLPVIVIPGHGIGTYNIGAADGSTFATGTNVEDVYVLSENYIQMPYLGSPDPVPIEIPIGIPNADGTGCLTRRFIVWWMVGLALPVPIFQGKVRITTA